MSATQKHRSLKNIASDGFAQIRFAMPIWWRVAELRDDDHVGFECVGWHNDAATGRIVVVVKKRTVGDVGLTLVREHAESLKRNMHLAGAPVVPVDPPPGYERAWVYQPNAHYNGSRFDAPVIAYENDEYVVMLALVGICREESPEWWQVNKATFELVRDTLRVSIAPGGERKFDISDAVAV